MSLSMLREILTAVLSIAIGQVPAAALIVGWYRISLYQPLIYRDLLWFLAVPALIGLLATWCVFMWRSAIWIVSLLSVMAFGLVYYVYVTFPPSHFLHPLNWLLSYCAWALLAAAVAKIIVDLALRALSVQRNA